MAGGKFLYANLPYDAQKDFIIAAPLHEIIFALAVSANSPAKSVADLTALLKKKSNALRHQQLDRDRGNAGLQDTDGFRCTAGCLQDNSRCCG